MITIYSYEFGIWSYFRLTLPTLQFGGILVYVLTINIL